MTHGAILGETNVQRFSKGQLFVNFPKTVRKNFPVAKGVKVVWLSINGELVLRFKPKGRERRGGVRPVLVEE